MVRTGRSDTSNSRAADPLLLKEFLLDIIVIWRYGGKGECCHPDKDQKDTNCTQTSADIPTMSAQRTRARVNSISLLFEKLAEARPRARHACGNGHSRQTGVHKSHDPIRPGCAVLSGKGAISLPPMLAAQEKTAKIWRWESGMCPPACQDAEFFTRLPITLEVFQLPCALGFCRGLMARRKFGAGTAHIRAYRVLHARLDGLCELTKSKKHYVGLTWANGDQKGGFAMQCDKNDYRGVLAALEGVSGKRAVNSDAMTVKN